MTKTKGTKEWAGKNINFSKGCSNACRYCYARRMANRFGWKSWDDWANMVNRNELGDRKFKKTNGVIMTPSSHDITPENLDLAKKVFKNLLIAGNQLLIVTKPNLKVIQELKKFLVEFQDNIIWRFTIGTLDDKVRKQWEPNAPPIPDRLTSLKELFVSGWKTSVSIEPFLDKKLIDLIKEVEPYVTDTIWIGPMNKIHVPKELWTMDLNILYSPENLYNLKSKLEEMQNPKIRFKDHFLSTIKKLEP